MLSYILTANETHERFCRTGSRLPTPVGLDTPLIYILLVVGGARGGGGGALSKKRALHGGGWVAKMSKKA